jgi:hypothetical protein
VTEPEPLPPELGELLRAARPLDAAPAETRERLARRVALSVALPAAVGSGAGAVLHTRQGLLSPLAQKLFIGVTGLVLGGGIGAATHAALTAPAPSVVAPPAALAPPASSIVAPVVPVAPAAADIPTVSVGDLPPAPPPLVAAARAPAAAPASPAAAANGLADERRLLDGARAALSRGEAASAMPPLDEHARRFPHGVLTEEREALAIQALARGGRTREAEERAARFEKAFPGSFMSPAIKDALGAAHDHP